MALEIERIARFAGLGPAGTSTAPYKIPLAKAYVYLLAEHLDTMLAAGEDLLASAFTWSGSKLCDMDAARCDRETTRREIAAVRALEMSLVAHTLRAREHAANLARRESEFGPVARLFIAGTAILADAAADLAGADGRRFKTGDAVSAYLRSRGLIARDAAAPMDGETVHISEDFRVARRIPLGPLLDLAAQFLDVLDAHYDLFLESPEPAPRSRARPAAPVQETDSEPDGHDVGIEAEQQPALSLAEALAEASRLAAVEATSQPPAEASVPLDGADQPDAGLKEAVSVAAAAEALVAPAAIDDHKSLAAVTKSETAEAEAGAVSGDTAPEDDAATPQASLQGSAAASTDPRSDAEAESAAADPSPGDNPEPREGGPQTP